MPASTPRPLHRLAPLLAAVALAGSAAAQEPAFLVEDINPTFTEQDSNPSGFTRVADQVYFAARGGLWVIDAPGAPPRLVEAELSGSVTPQLAFGNRLLLSTSDAIWISDGSEAGTVRLAPQPPRVRPVLLGGFAYFLTYESPGGWALWRTDGSPAGTQRVALLGLPGSEGEPDFLLRFGDALYFATNTDDDLLASAGAVWRSDGTELGTEIVLSFQGPCCHVVANLAASGDRLHFVVDEGDYQLWTSDGTAAGSERLLQLPVRPSQAAPPPLADADGTLFFAANDGGGAQLWRTDGTVANTVELTDLTTHPSLGIDRVVGLGDGAFFRRRLPNGLPELWFSDGTPNAAVLLGPYAALSLVAGPPFAYFGGDAGALWRSDGTVAGTVPIAAGFGPGPTNILPDEQGIYFSAQGLDLLGVEPWVYDPVAELAMRIGDLAPALPNAFCGRFFVCYPVLAALGDAVLFHAETGSDFALWRSDGTPAGTFPVSDVRATPLGTLGDALLLQVGGELWRTDGTDGGTVQVKDIRPGPQSSYPSGPFPVLGDFAYFSANDGSHGIELWRTDGSEAGTTLVKDVLPGFGGSEPARLFVWGDRLVFTADDGVSGREPWLSDGTEGGTARLVDIVPGPGSSEPERYNALGGLLFFAARDTQGVELWTSDGSEGGTARLVDLWPGPLSSSPTLLRPLGGQMIFVASDPDHGEEIWRSDGTALGTELLADLTPGPSGSAPRELVLAGDRLFFIAGPFADRGLAVSDGTPEGTHLVFAPSDPRAPVNPGQLLALGSKVIFTAGLRKFPAFFGLLPAAIWVSDGTPEGTVPLAEVGIPNGSRPGDDVFEVAGDFVFFSGYDDEHGQELWALPLAAVVPEPAASALGAAAVLALAGLRRRR